MKRIIDSELCNAVPLLEASPSTAYGLPLPCQSDPLTWPVFVLSSDALLSSGSCRAPGSRRAPESGPAGDSGDSRGIVRALVSWQTRLALQTRQTRGSGRPGTPHLSGPARRSPESGAARTARNSVSGKTGRALTRQWVSKRK